MNKRTKFLLGIGVIATLVIAFQVAAFAIHDDAFELEGNAINNFAGPPPDPNQAGDDWDVVLDNDEANDSAEETSFAEELDTNASIFTGGGSKDPQDIPAWQWKNGAGGLPDKANLQHSFAASYTVGTAPNQRELLYFGADRIDGSGDAAIAFWFFQKPVAQTPAGASQGTFTEEHETGDLLVISNFSNGGVVSTITAYEWNSACTKAGVQVDPDGAQGPRPTLTCGAQNLLILADSTDASCLGSPTPDNACAVVNGATTELPWTFVNKSGTGGNQALRGEFFEGGVDLTALGLGGQCFASTVAETRTSTSPTSVLKDFTIAPFGACSATMTTKASQGANITPGTSVTDTATLTGSGTTPPISPTGTITFFLCGPGQDDPVTAAGCPEGTGSPVPAAGTPVNLVAGANGTATATSSAVSPTATGKYCFRAEYDSGNDPNYDDATHTNATVSDPADATNFGECFTVQDTSGITTQQSFIPQDSATVTTTGGSAVGGSVEFKLYDSLTNCQNNAALGLLYEETDTVTGASPQTTSTNNDGVDAAGDTVKDGYTVDAEGNYTLFWRVTYTPTAGSGVVSANSHCVEDTAATVDNTTAPPSN